MPPIEYGAALPDEAVGDPAAAQAHQVDHRGVEPVDGAGFGIGEAETAVRDGGGHVEDQQRAHAVVAEALPHLGQEEGGETAGMAEEGAVPMRAGGVGRRHWHSAHCGILAGLLVRRGFLNTSRQATDCNS